MYLEFQREHGRTLLPERFDDDGYSGASLNRPALNRLPAHIRHGEVDRILVHRLDRLSRSVRDCATLLDEFRCLEVGLVIVTAPELGLSAQDNFLLNIMASFAEFEREMIATRIAESRERLKARHLRIGGGIPFGYDSNRRTRPLVRNEAETAIVRWMFAEAAAGKKPWRRCAIRLTSGCCEMATEFGSDPTTRSSTPNCSRSSRNRWMPAGPEASKDPAMGRCGH